MNKACVWHVILPAYRWRFYAFYGNAKRLRKQTGTRADTALGFKEPSTTSLVKVETLFRVEARVEEGAECYAIVLVKDRCCGVLKK